MLASVSDGIGIGMGLDATAIGMLSTGDVNGVGPWNVEYSELIVSLWFGLNRWFIKEQNTSFTLNVTLRFILKPKFRNGLQPLFSFSDSIFISMWRGVVLKALLRLSFRKIPGRHIRRGRHMRGMTLGA